MKKIIMFTSLFVCFYSLCFSQTKELQFRSVLTEQESKTISFDKYIDDFGKEIFVDKEILLSNKDIEKMGIVRSSQEFPGESIVMIIFTDSGKSKFFEVTRKNINNQIAVIVDDKVLASPYIRESIDTGWTAIPITSFKEAEELIKNLGFVPYLHGDIKNSNDENDSYGYAKYAMEKGNPKIAQEIILQLYKYNPKSEFIQKLLVEYPSLVKIKEQFK